MLKLQRPEARHLKRLEARTVATEGEGDALEKHLKDKFFQRALRSDATSSPNSATRPITRARVSTRWSAPFVHYVCMGGSAVDVRGHVIRSDAGISKNSRRVSISAGSGRSSGPSSESFNEEWRAFRVFHVCLVGGQARPRRA